MEREKYYLNVTETMNKKFKKYMYLPKTTYDWVKRVGSATDGFSKEERRDNRDRHCGEMKETEENSKK